MNSDKINLLFRVSQVPNQHAALPSREQMYAILGKLDCSDLPHVSDQCAHIG
jgi:hypothetical protein